MATRIPCSRSHSAAAPAGAARQFSQRVLLLLGQTSPPWARQITADLAAALPESEVAELPGVGHDALDRAPDQLAAELDRFLGD